ncbi:cell division protein FtsL [Granulicatella balaenopterae]|uniref:Cell division protein FtsL n=1 Tax=Granulicatella balaenopterae TaxID=137733 RepID=A0A1H9ICX4_9LACT|nr:hypothetical protein [Granulicatella balaenopterae]SEQ72433.1 cell division protein FtsL [Granulicatella balaenopterae]
MALAEEYFDHLTTNTKANTTTHPNVEIISPPNDAVIPQVKVKTNYGTFAIASIMFLAFLAAITILSTMVVSNKNHQLQDIKTNTTIIQQDNDVLLQSVQELSQYDRVMEIAKEKGFQMNEENVRNVEK